MNYTEIKEQFNQDKSQIRQQKNDIRENDSLSAKGKREKINELDNKLDNIQRESIKKAKDARGNSVEKYERKLFGASDSELQGVRDGLSKLEDVEPKRYRSMLEDASLTGDKGMQKAVALKAYKNGQSNIVEDWATSNDTRAETFNNLQEAKANEVSEAQFSMDFSKAL